MIIVTGGAGFIGSNIVSALEKRGEKDIAVCDFPDDTDGRWRNLEGRRLAAKIAPADLPGFLDQNAGKITAIIHMGAISATTETDLALLVENNYMYTRRLWEWCARTGVPFIYASSASTYGDGALGFSDAATDVAGLAVYRPLNGYGWSKQLFDRFAAMTVEQGDPATIPPQWVGLKFFNVYGPNEYHKGGQKSVICGLYPQICDTGRARLFKSGHPDYADGGQMRDFVYVRDCVDVVLWFLDHPDRSGIFNVGTGKARTFTDLARSCFAAIGRDPVIEYIDMPAALTLHYQYFTQADMAKLRAAGYDKPFTTLEDGVKDYVQNYMSNEHNRYN